MRLRDIARALLGRSTPEMGPGTPLFTVEPDSDGVNLLADPAAVAATDRGEADALPTAQLIIARALHGQDIAEANPGGFHIASADAVTLDDEITQLFGFPDSSTHRWSANITSTTATPAFRIGVVAAVDGIPTPIRRHGPFLTIGASTHLATRAQLSALQAIEEHAALPNSARTENRNVALVAALQKAIRDGLPLDLAHFSRVGWKTTQVSTVGVTATVRPDKSLLLTPSLNVDATEAELESRWHQLSDASDGGVLRVGKTLVSLDRDATGAVREVLDNRVIPAADVPTFLKTPSAFLDPARIDLDLGFSVRVEGIGRLTHIEFGDDSAVATDWFSGHVPLKPAALQGLVRVPEDLERFETSYRSATAQKADSVRFDAEIIDVTDHADVDTVVTRLRERFTNTVPADEEAAVPAPDPEDEPHEKVGFLLRDAGDIVSRLHERARAAIRDGALDTSMLAREPFPHQEEGIVWMSGMMRSARDTDRNDLYRLQGALLADDMGLGKTFMALAAIQQVIAEVESSDGEDHVRPTLIVAPLSLLENWEDEIRKTFRRSPFRDTVVLQSQRDLHKYRIAGAHRETEQLSSGIDSDGHLDTRRLRLGLRVGAGAGVRRLDVPGRLVLTTYETLRDYQFSLSQIDWGVVVFDEAQRTKNPSIAATRAAKALKADFKLLATGTPVENSLGEFWCLIDTAQPGLLGDWPAFRERYITPAVGLEPGEAAEERQRLGRELRSAVGPFMLRRAKEDHLQGLPPKIVHNGASHPGEADYDERLDRTMPDPQRGVYDAHLSALRSARLAGERTTPLSVLQSLRLSSIHPEFDIHDRRPSLPTSRAHALAQVAESAKLDALVEILTGVRAAGEKAIVFALSNNVQLLASLWITKIFGIRPDIVNGKTKAVSGRGGASRREIIKRFEQAPGFHVIVMSPVAAGVGLTIVAANHVIHLERHWNPAKEAQATDRVYRIGQTRPVHVYHPVARHPAIESFDVLIDRMLRRKVTVKDSVMVTGDLSPAEIGANLLPPVTAAVTTEAIQPDRSLPDYDVPDSRPTHTLPRPITDTPAGSQGDPRSHRGGGPTDAAWQEALEDADPCLTDALAQMARDGSPVPEIGYEAGEELWPVECAWPDARVAVLVDADEARDAWLTAQGWQTVRVIDTPTAEDVATLSRWLSGPTR